MVPFSNALPVCEATGNPGVQDELALLITTERLDGVGICTQTACHVQPEPRMHGVQKAGACKKYTDYIVTILACGHSWPLQLKLRRREVLQTGVKGFGTTTG